jgi:hypothetical protein
MRSARPQDGARCAGALVGALALAAVVAHSAEPEGCAVVRDTARRACEAALAAGDSARALDSARRLQAACPDEAPAARLLARSYLAADNLVMAGVILGRWTEAHAGDCETRSWLAAVLTLQGDRERARQILAAPGCPGGEAERGRWALLRARLAEGDDRASEATQFLAEVGERAPLFGEDRALWRELSARLRPAWRPPLDALVELALGATSNAFAGTPTDTPGTGTASLVGRPSLSLRLRAPQARVMTPVIELDTRGQGSAASAARDLSHVQLAGRAGLELGRGRVRPVLLYRYEELRINRQDDARFFFAHRGEVEVALSPAVSVLAGLGRRTHADDWRTRSEADGALLVGGSVRGVPSWAALSVRVHDAQRAVYDLRGATLLGLSEVPLRPRVALRVAASVAYDSYPRSGGPDGRIAFGTSALRRDLTTRLSLGAWLRGRGALRLGATYELGRRFSSADDLRLLYFPFTEHRLLIQARLALAGNPWRRRAPVGADHVPLPHALSEAGAAADLRALRQLLSQPDELRAPCGCTLR